MHDAVDAVAHVLAGQLTIAESVQQAIVRGERVADVGANGQAHRFGVQRSGAGGSADPIAI